MDSRDDHPTPPRPRDLPGRDAVSAAPTVDLPPGRREPGRTPSGRFAPGALVAGRYRILRFIAAGGMGEVYEADDLELGVRVALKTLRPEITRDAKAVERFRQEIALARKVTHRNVCRIFDVGWHHEGPPPADGTPAAGGEAFLTMEILSGETLAEHLAREGALTPADALPLLRQMAEALAAAHKAGVVHRDFKSGNVMLVPAHGGFRVVVTDFGLARSRSDADTTATGPGEIVGTPAYMAPEQLQGGAVTPATDVYAFGVVMFEVLTGRKPFSGDLSLASVLQRLRKGETSPDLRGAHLGKGLEPVLLKCLDREPALRYTDGGILLEALSGVDARRSRRGLWWALGAGAAVVLAAAIVVPTVVLKTGSGRAAAPRPAVHMNPRRTVAVLGFKNLSGRSEAAWFSTAIAEMLTTEISAGDHLRTVPGEVVSRMKMDLGEGDADSLAPDTLARIRQNLGADVVVLGSYVALGGPDGPIRLDVRLQDAVAGETLASFAETGKETTLFDMASHLGAALRAKLGAGPVTPAEAAAAQAALPADPKAARLYAEGLAHLRVLETSEALARFQAAAAADPTFPRIHSELSEAWAELGYDARALAEAKLAFDLSASLPKEGRMSAEARYWTLAGDWDKAVDLYRALWEFFPDDLDQGLLLADAQSRAGKGKEALQTLQQLSRLPGAAGQDPRIDIAEGEAAQSFSDWKGVNEAATRAAEKAKAAGARLLLARARVLQAAAWRKMGDAPKALEAAREAQSLYEKAGDRQRAADAERQVVYVLNAQGDLAATKALATKLLATYRSLGNRRGTVMMLNALANVAYSEGDLRSASSDYEECLKVLKEIDDRNGFARVEGNLANVLLLQGDAAGARRLHEEALALKRELGDEGTAAYSLVALGELEWTGGDLKGGEARYREALELFRKSGEKSGEAYALYGLGEVALARADFSGARADHGQALALRERLGEKDTVGESRLALATLDLEEGRALEAEASARQILKGLGAEGSADTQALAWDLVARARLDRADAAGAKEAAAKAEALIRGEEDRTLHLAVAITSAHARGAAGDLAGGRKALEALQAEAMRCGRENLAFRARLALGALDKASGDAAAGRARLDALEKDASAQDFTLVAKRAAAGR